MTGRSVLIADDDATTLETLQLLLQISGFDVRTTTTAEAALRWLSAKHFDVAVSDLRLPDFSGIELLRRARQQGLALPFVIVTGFADLRTAVDAMRLGAVDYLEKPVLGDELIRAIRRAVAATEASSEGLHLVSHCASRWADVVLAVVSSDADCRTIAQWSRVALVSQGTLKNWCNTAGISARRSLVFARILRAVVLRERTGLRLEDILDVVDRRTMHALASCAGFSRLADLPHTVVDYLSRQRLVTNGACLDTIQKKLDALGYVPVHRKKQ